MNTCPHCNGVYTWSEVKAPGYCPQCDEWAGQLIGDAKIQELPNGSLIHDLDNEDYHRGPGISKSGLDLIARSPMHYHHARQYPKRPTKAMEIGTAFHVATLEPDLLENRVIMGLETANGQPLERRKAIDKKAWADFELEHGEKIILSRDEMDRITAMRDAVLTHSHAGPLLRPDDGPAELSGYWTDPQTEVLCRIRPDKLNERHHVVIDLKSTLEASVGNASWRSFERSAAQHRYHVSDAMTSFGWKVITGEPLRAFVFVCVEKEPPHGVGIYRMDDQARAVGRELMSRDIDTYAWCLERNEWPGYAEKIRDLQLPGWALD